jgi:hypothetical protein
MDALPAPKANVLRADLCLVDERYEPALLFRAPKPKTNIGRGGTNFSSTTTFTHSYDAGKNLSRSSKSSHIDIETDDLPPTRSPSELKQWRTRYVRLARRSPGWGPRMSEKTPMETLTSGSSVQERGLSTQMSQANPHQHNHFYLRKSLWCVPA